MKKKFLKKNIPSDLTAEMVLTAFLGLATSLRIEADNVEVLPFDHSGLVKSETLEEVAIRIEQIVKELQK